MTYNEFIQQIITTRGQWNIPENEYFELHHIIPKCMGGLGDTTKNNFRRKSHHENCIWLYAREHFIAHKLLAEENPENFKLVMAFYRMTISKQPNGNSYIATPEEYEEAAKMASHVKSIASKKYWSEHYNEMCEKARATNTTPEYRKNMSRAIRESNAKNGAPSQRPEVRACISTSLMGHEVSEKTREKIRNNQNCRWNKGKKWYNNGTQQSAFNEGEQPEGWVWGRLVPKHYNKKKKETKE